MWGRKTFGIVAAFVLALSAAQAGVPASTDVIVIGAGLSGLSAAHELKKSGLKYHVLELTPRVGGRVRTVQYHQYGPEVLSADSGMEEYWESNPAVELLKELGVPVRGDIAASSIVLNKKLYSIGDEEDGTQYLKRIFTPAEYKALEAFKARVAPYSKQMAKFRDGKPLSPEWKKLKDTSFEAWVKGQKIPTKVAEWIRISVECEIGTSWSRISALDGMAEFHIFLGAGEKSYRVMGGNERFTNALAASIGSDNLSLNKRVARIVQNGNSVTVHYVDAATNEGGQITASHVISTIPLFRLLIDVQIQPPLSEKKMRAIQTQTWGSYFKAHIFLPKKSFEREGLTALPVLSDSEVGVVYDGNAGQNTAVKILSLLVTGDPAEQFNLMPLDIVRKQIDKKLDHFWPGLSKEIMGVEFFRIHPRAIAAWPVGRSRFDEGSQAVRAPEGRLYLAGDFTENSHSDGAVRSAYRAVAQIRARDALEAKALLVKEPSKERSVSSKGDQK